MYRVRESQAPRPPPAEPVFAQLVSESVEERMAAALLAYDSADDASADYITHDLVHEGELRAWYDERGAGPEVNLLGDTEPLASVPDQADRVEAIRLLQQRTRMAFERARPPLASRLDDVRQVRAMRMLLAHEYMHDEFLFRDVAAAAWNQMVRTGAVAELGLRRTNQILNIIEDGYKAAIVRERRRLRGAYLAHIEGVLASDADRRRSRDGEMLLATREEAEAHHLAFVRRMDAIGREHDIEG